MNIFVCLCALVTITSAASIPQDAQATIDHYENTNEGSGNYKFSFRTSNDISRSETGEFVNAGQPNEHIVVRGEYSYIGHDGNLVEVHYVADENGFQIIKPPNRVTSSFAGYSPNVVATLLG